MRNRLLFCLILFGVCMQLDWAASENTTESVTEIAEEKSSVSVSDGNTNSTNSTNSKWKDLQGDCPEDDGSIPCDHIENTNSFCLQVPIRNCHYQTTTHPRQVEEGRPKRTPEEKAAFHHLAIFNIRYDLDFQEAGDRCSVRLQQEWLLAESGPVPLDEYSFNRIWYDRMCSPFSYLECVPWEEIRTKSKRTPDNAIAPKKMNMLPNPHANHTHPGALPDKHDHLPPEQNLTKVLRKQQELPNNLYAPTKRPRDPESTLLDFEDSGRDTSRMKRKYIGGRGPGKGRHKSGPGAQRVDPQKLIGIPQAFPVEGYELDGICTCSQFDPKYKDRKRPNYGMNFVEDEMRPDWCVAAPGNLCGRVFFPPNVWPGQNFEFSDHIGCPKRYKGVEYECIRWSLNKIKDNTNNAANLKPHTETCTCEKKQEMKGTGFRVRASPLLSSLVVTLSITNLVYQLQIICIVVI